MLKYLLRYLVFVGIPYALAKKIEKRYLRSKNNPDNKPDSRAVDFRGGEIFTATGIAALLMKDLAFKVALTGLVGSSIWSDMADTGVEQVLKYAGAIAAAPGHKFVKIVKRFRSMNVDHTLDIKEKESNLYYNHSSLVSIFFRKWNTSVRILYGGFERNAGCKR
jgi:hypothetical protein